MKSVLLAGGLGVRLRPLTYTIPKPLLPVGEHPILEEIIIRLKRFELRDIVIAVGYRAELIETYFRDGSHLGVHVEYAHESEPLGTAGPLALVRKQFGHSAKDNDSLLVMNGDLLTEIDMRRLIDFHEEGGNDITVVTREFQLKHPYGVIELDRRSNHKRGREARRHRHHQCRDLRLSVVGTRTGAGRTGVRDA